MNKELYQVYYDKFLQIWSNDDNLNNKAIGLMTLITLFLGFLVQVGLNKVDFASSSSFLEKIIFIIGFILIILSMYFSLLVLTPKKYNGYSIRHDLIKKEKDIDLIFQQLNERILSTLDSLDKEACKIKRKNFNSALLFLYWGMSLILLVSLNNITFDNTYFLIIGALIIFFGSFKVIKK